MVCSPEAHPLHPEEELDTWSKLSLSQASHPTSKFVILASWKYLKYALSHVSMLPEKQACSSGEQVMGPVNLLCVETANAREMETIESSNPRSNRSHWYSAPALAPLKTSALRVKIWQPQ